MSQPRNNPQSAESKHEFRLQADSRVSYAHILRTSVWTANYELYSIRDNKNYIDTHAYEETCLLLRISHLVKTTEIHTQIHKVQILTG